MHPAQAHVPPETGQREAATALQQEQIQEDQQSEAQEILPAAAQLQEEEETQVHQHQ